MTLFRAIDLVRNWAILVECDIDETQIVSLALLMRLEVEKEVTLINSGSCIYHECDDATRIS